MQPRRSGERRLTPADRACYWLALLFILVLLFIEGGR